MNIYSNLLTDKKELEQSQLLFYSFENSDYSFERCFFDLFNIDYQTVFGNRQKECFLFDILGLYYRNDFFIRYSFIKKILCKSSAISFEEFPIANSRIDLASINGKSVAYEIKSEYDNYSRLAKQIDDYSKCFEFVYVICPKKRLNSVLSIVPQYCGIYTYTDSSRPVFEKCKEAHLTPNLQTIEMLKLLRKKELTSFFGLNDAGSIDKKYSKEKINHCFKSALKQRFCDRWCALKNRAYQIYNS